MKWKWHSGVKLKVECKFKMAVLSQFTYYWTEIRWKAAMGIHSYSRSFIPILLFPLPFPFLRYSHCHSHSIPCDPWVSNYSHSHAHLICSLYPDIKDLASKYHARRETIYYCLLCRALSTLFQNFDALFSIFWQLHFLSCITFLLRAFQGAH